MSDTLQNTLKPNLEDEVLFGARSGFACWKHWGVAQVVLCARVSSLQIFGSTQWRTRAGRSSQALRGHLRVCCLFWSAPGVLSINFDAAGCHAGCQGRAGPRKIPGTYSPKDLASLLFAENLEHPPKQRPASLQQVATQRTQGTSRGPPAGLRVQLEGLGMQGLSDGVLRIGRYGLAGKRQSITQGCGA
eukprot:1158618-Pelagomonas_calceolata.AAC.2